MQRHLQDLTIIGGGVMGLFTAYYASHFTQNITMLEKSYIGNKMTASFGYTRSIRNDYLDADNARLAYEAHQLWQTFEQTSAEPFIVACGCLNLAKANVTPHFEQTYGAQSFQILTDLHLKAQAFTRQTLQQRFPQFAVDQAYLDIEAGFLYVPAVTQALLSFLRAKNVNIVENVEVGPITEQDGLVQIATNQGIYTTHQLVMTAGHGTNALLQQLADSNLHFPITPDRPKQCKYFIPPVEKRTQFTSDVLPVFAYLDIGVYGHPIYAGKTPGVKIGFYNPPDATQLDTHIHDVESFVEECMPDLQDAEVVDVQDVDQCFYDLVDDDTFILGNLPGHSNIHVGVGWRGTGYKYAPWIGKVLMQLALQRGTVYDIQRFTPQRFVHEA